MMMNKQRNRIIYAILGLFLLASNARGQATLVSVRQGEGRNKSWAIFSFNEKAQWIGVSQSENHRLSLYFSARAGEMQDKTWTIDPASGSSVAVKQASRRPPILRADLVCDLNTPLAVLKKGRLIVVAFNDIESIVEKTAVYENGDDIQSNGRLVNVDPVVEADQVRTSLLFDGYHDWVGYLRPSSDSAALLFHGARLFTDTDDFEFSASALRNVRFYQGGDGKRLNIRAMMSFSTPTSFSIVKKPDRMVVQTAYDAEQGILQVEEAEAIPESVLIDSSEAGTTQEVSLDEIITNIEDELDVIDEESYESPMTSVPVVFEPDSDITDIHEIPVADDNIVSEEDTNTLDSTVQEEIPDERQVELPLETQIEIAEGIPWDEEVSFEFNNIPVRDALRLIASGSNLNMVIDEGVEGMVTMDLRRVTLKQAIDRIVYTHNCEYIIDEGIITVKPVTTVYTGGSVTRVYRLKYADAENVASVIRQVVSSDTLVKVFHPEFLHFPESGRNRKAANDVAVQGIRRSSILVVTDRPEKIREVDKVIRELDRAPYQIMIESKLVELAPIHTNELGINWDKTINAVLWNQAKLNQGTNIDYSFFNEDPNAGTEWQVGSISAGKYQAVLDFLREKTDSKLKSNPRLLAMDNEESSISVGTTVPVPRIQRGMGGQGDMVTFDYKEVNIQLNVTPHVTKPNEITMYVNPIIEEITGWVEYEQHRAPITDKRTVNSIVSVKNGETVVIGGLIKSQRIRTMSKVWLLGSLPLLGRLFQHESFEDKQTDLMIFITPRIIQTG